MFDRYLTRWALTPDGHPIITRTSHLLPVRRQRLVVTLLICNLTDVYQQARLGEDHLMSTTTSDQGMRDPRTTIIDAVSQRWDTKKSAFLLSQLGNQYASEIRSLNPTQLPLKRLIEAFFGDELTVVSLSQFGGLVHGVVPKKAGTPNPDEVVPQPSDPESRMRFMPVIWAALHRTIETPLRRYLCAEGNRFVFTDLAPTESTPAGTLVEIRTDDLVPSSATKEQAAKHIADFLRSKGLNPVAFMMGRSAPPAEVASMLDSVPISGRKTLLDELLSILTPIEQRQTMLPLSVVAKLRHHGAR